MLRCFLIQLQNDRTAFLGKKKEMTQYIIKATFNLELSQIPYFLEARDNWFEVHMCSSLRQDEGVYRVSF